jgi:hypothetical protein
MLVPRSLRVLLAHSIDYTGMFPPCSFGLQQALENHSAYLRSPDACMLGAFVLSVEHFSDAKDQLSHFDPKHPLRVSALGPRTANAADFRNALPEVVFAISAFSAHNVDLLSVDQFEMALPPDVDLRVLRDAQSVVGQLRTFWETPVGMAASIIPLLAEHNSETDSPPFGLNCALVE